MRLHSPRFTALVNSFLLLRVSSGTGTWMNEWDYATRSPSLSGRWTIKTGNKTRVVSYRTLEAIGSQGSNGFDLEPETWQKKRFGGRMGSNASVPVPWGVFCFGPSVLLLFSPLAGFKKTTKIISSTVVNMLLSLRALGMGPVAPGSPIFFFNLFFSEFKTPFPLQHFPTLPWLTRSLVRRLPGTHSDSTSFLFGPRPYRVDEKLFVICLFVETVLYCFVRNKFPGNKIFKLATG